MEDYRPLSTPEVKGVTMLEPCPFCGGDPTFDRETTREVNTFFDSTYIRCTKCGVRTRGNIDKGRSEEEIYITFAITDACLTREQVKDYSKGKDVYGWRISHLVIYDQPRSISEFFVESNATHDCPSLVPMKRPPQSWCYVYGGAG